jgi:hypothetical protein
LTAAQQLALGLAAHPDDVGLLQRQAAHDRAAIAFAARLRAGNRITNARYVQEVTGYQSDLVQTLDHINQIRSDAARKVADARKQAALAAKRHLDEQKRALKEGQRVGEAIAKDYLQGVTGLGYETVLGPKGAYSGRLRASLARAKIAQFAVPLGLQLAQARAEAVGTPAEVQSIIRREKEAAEKAVKSGKLSLNAQIEAWNFITQANQQLTQGLNEFGPTGKVASSQALTSGIAFKNAAARRAQEARIAQLISHGGRLPAAMSVQGQTVVEFHHTTVLDGAVVARSVTEHQTKAARHRAAQNSGIHAGKPLP